MKKLTLMQASAGLASGEFTAAQLTAAALAQIADERGRARARLREPTPSGRNGKRRPPIGGAPPARRCRRWMACLSQSRVCLTWPVR